MTFTSPVLLGVALSSILCQYAVIDAGPVWIQGAAQDQIPRLRRKNRGVVFSNSNPNSSRDVEALIQFKAGISTDPNGALDSWTTGSADACSWYGIRCDSYGNVIGIILSSQALVGTISAAVGLLVNLMMLELSNNSFTGTIPDALGNCSNLVELSLDTNQLTGTIPAALGQGLTQVQAISLHNNALTGFIPPSITNCTQLSSLYLNDNVLSGAIPKAIGMLSSLTDADLSNNVLAGEIPAAVGNLSQLHILSLQNNLLTGSLPITLLSCAKLAQLHLEDNYLTDAIPPGIEYLQSLRTLHLQNNSFTGSIPTTIGMNVVLENLNLADNCLSGSIPGTFGNLTVLLSLNLSGNYLSGNIPSSLGTCSTLETLDLSNNALNGTIPSSLGLLTSLHSLDLSYNYLDGSVPVALLTKFPDASFLGNPYLCLRESCAAPSATASSCHGFGCKSTLISVAVAGGCLALVLGLGCILRLFYFATKSKRQRRAVPEVVMFDSELKTLTVEEILQATNRFSHENKIGVGARSTVYRGTFPGGRTLAVKKFIAEDVDGDDPVVIDRVMKEVRTLGKIQHNNLVRILGACLNSDMTVLLLEFMSNGSLHRLFNEGNSIQLNWGLRFSIALDVAKALVYLHGSGCSDRGPIVHCDLKPTNILLNSSLEAKVGNFGMARFALPNSVDAPVPVSTICGTGGYIPPEYGATSRVSTKGDVYNYGIVLLELLTGKQPSDETFVEGVSLVKWVYDAFPDKVLDRIDPVVLFTHSHVQDQEVFENQIRHLMHLALLCTDSFPQNRPSMDEVLQLLLRMQQRPVEQVPFR